MPHNLLAFSTVELCVLLGVRVLLGVDKAPGPDGFPALFFHHYWDFISTDVSQAVLSFFNRGHLLKELNRTFITLIPKIPVPNNFKDFRPIGLCNTVYKIISKCLANRLQPLMDKVTTPFQNGFIKGRSITDNLILASELLTFIQKNKKRKKHWCALKLDIAKAYDKVSWNFLEAVLNLMRFPSHWIHLIMNCVRLVSYTLLFNGQMAGSFSPQCGLR